MRPIEILSSPTPPTLVDELHLLRRYVQVVLQRDPTWVTLAPVLKMPTDPAMESLMLSANSSTAAKRRLPLPRVIDRKSTYKSCLVVECGTLKLHSQSQSEMEAAPFTLPFRGRRTSVAQMLKMLPRRDGYLAFLKDRL
jgi:hypothetical protein